MVNELIEDNFQLRYIHHTDIEEVIKYRSVLCNGSETFVETMEFIDNSSYKGDGSPYSLGMFSNEKIQGVLTIEEADCLKISLGVLEECECLESVLEHLKTIAIQDELFQIECSLSIENEKASATLVRAGFVKELATYYYRASILVFNGSPKDGNCLKICNELEKLYYNVEVINAYEHLVTPCIDCTYCSKYSCKCTFNDMDDIYRKIEDSNIIVIVSPVHIASVSSPLLAIFSRLQIYYSQKFIIKEPFKFSKKKGFAIAVAGQDWDNQKLSMETIFKHALYEMNSNLEKFLYLCNSDSRISYTNDLQDLYKEMDNYAKRK